MLFRSPYLLYDCLRMFECVCSCLISMVFLQVLEPFGLSSELTDSEPVEVEELNHASFTNVVITSQTHPHSSISPSLYPKELPSTPFIFDISSDTHKYPPSPSPLSESRSISFTDPPSSSPPLLADGQSLHPAELPSIPLHSDTSAVSVEGLASSFHTAPLVPGDVVSISPLLHSPADTLPVLSPASLSTPPSTSLSDITPETDPSSRSPSCHTAPPAPVTNWHPACM